MDEALEQIAEYLCGLEVQTTGRAPFEFSNTERRAMFLARAEDLLRSCPALGFVKPA